MEEITRVAVDAMGGDNAPVEIVKVQWKLLMRIRILSYI